MQTSATLHTLNPLEDPRWEEFVELHPLASVFHSKAWLDAVYRTHNYVPVVFTTSSPTQPLKNALLFTSIRSWVTGSRLVSLPFSDHCEPLVDTPEELQFLLEQVKARMGPEHWKYTEIRPWSAAVTRHAKLLQFSPSGFYHWHQINLQPSLDVIFQNFDKDSVQRRVRRAERTDLIEKVGRTSDLLDDFYGLTVLTRKRQGIPPQPYAWFQNVLVCFRQGAEIRMAYTAGGLAVAGIITLKYKTTVTYKYGCSDERFKRFAATVLLLWRAIESAKTQGAKEFDLGRSEENNVGLVAFKDNWTKNRRRLTYWRYPSASSNAHWEKSKLWLAKRFFACLPKSALAAAGRALYRHAG